METAAAYLANRMRTVYELRKHLRDKEYSPEEIDELWEDALEYARFKAEQRRKKK